MSKIMIDSIDAGYDKADIEQCRWLLVEAFNSISILQNKMGASWDGESRNVCYERLSNFASRIGELTGRSDTAIRMIDTIVNTYRDADRATAGKMGD